MLLLLLLYSTCALASMHVHLCVLYSDVCMYSTSRSIMLRPLLMVACIALLLLLLHWIPDVRVVDRYQLSSVQPLSFQQHQQRPAQENISSLSAKILDSVNDYSCTTILVLSHRYICTVSRCYEKTPCGITEFSGLHYSRQVWSNTASSHRCSTLVVPPSVLGHNVFATCQFVEKNSNRVGVVAFCLIFRQGMEKVVEYTT